MVVDMTQSHDYIDVIIPVFNGEKTIQQALESVVAQQKVCIGKIIVVNDGSTDATISVIQSMKLPNLELITTSNHGVATARNTGVAAASSDWIAFLDADDCWLSEKLSNQLQIAQQYKVDFVCSATVPDCKKAAGLISYSSMWKGNFIATSSVLMKRELLQKIKPLFSTNMTFAEDYATWFKILTVSSGYFTPKNLTQYVISPQPHYRLGSIFRNLIILQKECFLFLLRNNFSVVTKISGSIFLITGISISMLSIVKRFLFAYVLNHRA